VDELYVGSFDGFVARRDAMAKRLRDEGDADEAKRVRSLKKPNRVAWALNQLGAQEPGLRDAVLEAGGELRSAQEALVSGKGDNAHAREAQRAERQAVHEAVAAADAIAQEDGAALGSAATERARQTLHAVALDEDVREQFASTRLTAHHEAVGLGPVSGAAPRAPAKRSRAERRQQAEHEAAEKELAQRKQAVTRAREELDGARKRAERAQKELDRAASELEDAETAAKEAEAELERLGDQDD
jgi:septal ring factor EnvC (AmiA/AmiB activator)